MGDVEVGATGSWGSTGSWPHGQPTGTQRPWTHGGSRASPPSQARETGAQGGASVGQGPSSSLLTGGPGLGLPVPWAPEGPGARLTDTPIDRPGSCPFLADGGPNLGSSVHPCPGVSQGARRREPVPTPCLSPRMPPGRQVSVVQGCCPPQGLGASEAVSGSPGTPGAEVGATGH